MMDNLLNTIAIHITSLTKLAHMCLLKVRYNNKHEFTEAIYIRLSSLNKLSKYIREDNSVERITIEIKLVKDPIDEISDNATVALEKIIYEPSLCIMMILNNAISSCYIANP